MTKLDYDKIILVFGSNLAGRHGKGAALFAKIHCNAKTGVGEGPTGNCYALPTKDENLKTRSLTEIAASVHKLHAHVVKNPDYLFLITPVGTGLAGYRKPLIMEAMSQCHWPSNAVFTSSWVNRNG